MTVPPLRVVPARATGPAAVLSPTMAAAGARHSGAAVSARMRILGWSVVLLLLSLLVSTTATHLLLSRRADVRIRGELQHEVDEFNALPATASGVQGAVRAKLRAATARAVPESEIVLIGLLDGRVYDVSGGAPAAALALSTADLTRLASTRAPTRGTVRIAGNSALYIALPVTAAGDRQQGTFVAAVMTGPERAAVWRVTRLQLEVGAGALLLASLLAWLAAGRVLRPIRATTELARSITDTDLSERLPVRGYDEVSQMAATFNAMLDRLQDSFATQRRFLADAGHELRTPITIIQGNLDILATRDPEDLETLTLVAEELSRMTRLVDELSLLAASERPDFLRPAPTDLAVLSLTLAAKAQALGDRGWAVNSNLTGWALLDAQRITQAVMQLAANAVAHTSDNVKVDMQFTVVGKHLRLSVIDHGAGVAVEDQDRVFDRFTRLDTRHAERTGLGLAIVAAIAAAHGGRIALTDTPGGGATFTVSVPYRAVPPPETEAAPKPLRPPPAAVAVAATDRSGRS
jgi:two-component system OmpR family sensor kinase